MDPRPSAPTTRRRSTALLAALAAVVLFAGLGVARTRGADPALTTVTVHDPFVALAADPAPTLLDVRNVDGGIVAWSAAGLPVMR